MIRNNILVEVAVDSVASARAAERGGASRIELCSSLAEGGLTPSAGLIETARAAVSMPIYVMIRPRSGDFCYDSDEFAAMHCDIAMAKQMEMSGVVFGLVDVNGNVDVRRTSRLADLARPLEVTFHRAFDITADLFRALEDVCATGANRVLTSGGEQTAFEGRENIAKLMEQAKGRIIVMPGSGIKPENARSLVEATGATEIHAGLRSVVSSSMVCKNPRISFGSAVGGEFDRSVVLEETVGRLCAALAEP